MELRSQAEIDCKFLAELLRDGPEGSGRNISPQERKAIRSLLLDDLAGRLSLLDREQRESVVKDVGSALRSQLCRFVSKEGVAAAMHSGENSQSAPSRIGSTKKYADAIIVTVLPVERDAVLTALGRSPDEREDFKSDGIRYYRAEVRSKRYGGNIAVWTGMISEPRNVPCANFVSQLHDHFEFNTVILVGIAGGNSIKCNLGDVVASTEILDNEGGVDLPRRGIQIGRRFFGMVEWQPRVKVFDNPLSLAKVLNGFSINSNAWHQEIRRVVESGGSSAMKFDGLDSQAAPELHQGGIIQAGEKLKRDGRLPETAMSYSDRLYAVEMEGSGFAQACRSRKYEWMVVRGISDFGDRRKNDKRQALAALSASFVVKQFLETEIETIPRDISF